MQTNNQNAVDQQAAAETTVPRHVFERMENEWRQIQTDRDVSRKPVTPSTAD